MFFTKIFLIISMFVVSNISYSVEYDHPDIYYNNALDSYQNGQLGKAMFDIKKAYLLAPNKEYIRKLFFTIRQDVGLPPIYSTDRLGSQIFAMIFASLPPHLNALIGALFFLLASVLVSLLLLGKLTGFKKVSLIGVWVFFVMSMMLFVQAGIQYHLFFSPDQRVILQMSPAYEEASFESTKLLDLPEGTEVTIIVKTKEFYLVRTLDGKEYWVNPQYIPVLWGELS